MARAEKKIEHTELDSYISFSQPMTVQLGKLLGGVCEPGDVIVLTGDLGAGKTQLTKGIAQGLGIDQDVTSPTFTIEMVYEGTLDLYHFDLYRLHDALELEDTGLFDVLEEDGVCVIEWGEQFQDEIGPNRLDIFLTRADDLAEAGKEPPRKMRLVAHAPRGKAMIEALDRAFCAESAHGALEE
ncbi:MAG: tRNA (adenosine(37)-N6)-threonylcarbamoyltransferase complex ATPase subunit type 1 TsaE [Atopobiaceae bacterium]|jgi:tRNA threonylcarbamoyladenosine biosynthesis protein TsaE